MKRLVPLTLALLLLLVSAPSRAQRAPDHLVHYRQKVMGTVVDVTIWTDDEKGAAKASQEVFDEFKRIDELMSSWLPDSDVSKVNSAAGKKPIKVDPEVFAVAVRAREAGKLTGGAFDVTVGAFRGLWKFDEDLDGSIPKAADVAARLPLINYKKLQINKKAGTLKLQKAGMRLTLGGVAKGYAVDQAIEILHKRGYIDFIVQAGGDLYASGRRGDRPWRVGIRDPRGRRDQSFALAEISDRTFSTSGDYERFVVKDGVRYHHILDPKTGYPAARSRSVTVQAKDAITADILSTALFVLGTKEGIALVEKLPDVEAVFVDKDNKVHASSGLKDKIIILKPPTDGI